VRYIIRVLLLLAVFVVSGSAQDQEPATPTSAATLTAEVQVCTGIKDRMPSDSATSFNVDVGSLYCWSRITGAHGETTVKHVWTHDGKEMAVVELSVKGDPWRTFSQKKIAPQWTGNWEVKVVDTSGATLKSISFVIGSPSK